MTSVLNLVLALKDASPSVLMIVVLGMLTVVLQSTSRSHVKISKLSETKYEEFGASLLRIEDLLAKINDNIIWLRARSNGRQG